MTSASELEDATSAIVDAALKFAQPMSEPMRKLAIHDLVRAANNYEAVKNRLKFERGYEIIARITEQVTDLRTSGVTPTKIVIGVEMFEELKPLLRLISVVGSKGELNVDESSRLLGLAVEVDTKNYTLDVIGERRER